MKAHRCPTINSHVSGTGAPACPSAYNAAVSRAVGGPHGPWTHHFARVNGVRLHYVRQGAGFPVILLHGWPGFWYDWARVIPPLARHHDVVAPDLRGFGYSGKPALPPSAGYRLEVAAQDIAGLARRLGFERVALVAYDIGSVVPALPSLAAGGGAGQRGPGRAARLPPPLPAAERRIFLALSTSTGGEPTAVLWTRSINFARRSKS